MTVQHWHERASVYVERIRARLHRGPSTSVIGVRFAPSRILARAGEVDVHVDVRVTNPTSYTEGWNLYLRSGEYRYRLFGGRIASPNMYRAGKHTLTIAFPYCSPLSFPFGHSGGIALLRSMQIDGIMGRDAHGCFSAGDCTPIAPLPYDNRSLLSIGDLLV